MASAVRSLESDHWHNRISPRFLFLANLLTSSQTYKCSAVSISAAFACFADGVMRLSIAWVIKEHNHMSATLCLQVDQRVKGPLAAQSIFTLAWSGYCFSWTRRS